MATSRRKWRVAISDRLRLDNQITYQDGIPTRYSLNLCGLIKGEWESLARYDNAHGSSHKHIAHPYRSPDVHPFLAVIVDTYLEAALTDLTANASEYLDEFERELGERE